MRAKKFLSMLLVVVMMLSLFPMNAFALGGGREIGIGGGFGRDIGDDEIREFDPTDYEAEGEDPVDFFQTTDYESGITVTVASPFNALPTKAEVRLQPVDPESVREAVESVVEGQPNILVAMDISFWLDGQEIEPDQPVNVKISAPELTDVQNLQVIHIPDAGEEDAMPNTVELVTEEEMSIPVGTNEIAFKANSFSVYVVVGEGDDGDEARATVNFISKDNTIATVYVKNSDTVDELKTIVYDPGTGTLASGEQFLGWSKEKPENHTADMDTMTISDIRNELAGLSIVEGETVVNYYAVICRTVTLTYMDPTNTVALSSVSGKLIGKTTSFDVMLDQPYSPTSGMAHFEGWLVQEGRTNIQKAVDPDGAEIDLSDVTTPIKNSSVLTITGDVVLGVTAPEGQWLVFNENGKGATYIAPQFVESGHNTQEPTLEMVRFGYTFGGWYTDKDCTDGNEFTFGGQITDRTEIYAKWTPAATANYTVLIWKQNVAGSGYDFAESVTIEDATVGSTANAVSARGTGDGSYAIVDGTPYQWTGFHLKEYDNNVTVKPEGDAVVNVRYDRNTITLKFYTFNATGYERSYDSSAQTGVEYYGRSGNQWTGYSYFRVYYYEGDWIYESGGNYYYYTGNRYIRTGSWSEQTSYQMQGLYGAQLNKTWPTNYNWYDTQYPGGSAGGTRWTFLDAFLPPDGSSAMNFYGQETNGDVPIQFYKQNADDDGYTLANTVYGTAGSGFYITDKYNGYTAFEYDVDGSGKTSVGTAVDGTYNGGESITYNTSLKIYFNRDEYSILYMDGKYVDGDNNTLEQTPRGQLNVKTKVRYGSNISSYNEGGADYYAPTYAGYTFSGWYVDDACTQAYTFTTMPEGITVYAKWTLNQYRVFLHPEADGDNSLDWGSASQALNFRRSNGQKVSLPTGKRGEYKFVGWFTAAGNAGEYFDADVTILNETTVTAAYDKTKDMTDTMDKWGHGATINADVNRPWITKKLDLYAHWAKILVGAEGIGIVYNAGEGGSGAPVDSTLYQDGAQAVAQSAVTRAPQGKQFECWVVQKWNGSDWENTSVEVYPGAEFFIIADDAKVQAAEGSTEDNPKNTYTIQLIAKYKDAEEETPTHIYWFANNGSGDVQKNENIKINEAVNIPTPTSYMPNGGNRAVGLSFEDYTFIGWAKSDAVESSEESGSEESSTNTEIKEFGYDDLFLRWEDDKYLAEVDDEWVEVDRVAADEVTPYEDLYAVWVKTFYVYHTGTNQVERVMLPASNTSTEAADDTAGTFSLTALVDTKNFLYGGYYTQYTGASAAFKANAEALAYTRADSISGYADVTQINGLADKGNVFTAKDKADGDGKAIAYTGDTAGMFTIPYTVDPGNAIHPVAGAVYYIKEVPAADFLLPRLRYTYRAIDGKIGTAWLATNLDDENYGDVGFMIGETPVVCTEDGDKVTSFTMIPKTDESKAVTYYVGDEPAGTGTKEKLFPKGALFSYTKVYNKPIYDTKPDLNYGEEISTLKAGEKVVMFWVTPDGMKVTSTATRTYTNIDTTALSIKDSTPQTSSITLYSAS